MRGDPPLWAVWAAVWVAVIAAMWLTVHAAEQRRRTARAQAAADLQTCRAILRATETEGHDR